MNALAEEVGGIDLGDRRLNRRAQRLLEQLGGKPTVSIPAACGGWSETRAAYRLFDHEQVTAEAVLAPHIGRTVERMVAHPRVLCSLDTSEIDYTGRPSMQGLGLLSRETRQGLYPHPTLALTPERLRLGLLGVHRWVREPGSLGQDKDPNRPLEDKKSVRWVDGCRQVDELAAQLPDTRLTYVADREADIYALFVEAPCPEAAADWLVRGPHDRILANGKTLPQHLTEAAVLTETTFEQPASHGCKARTVHQQVRALRVTLTAPHRPDRTLPEVEITATLASEPHPPAGEEPVDWLLLTNLHVDTPEQALEKLQCYLCGWQIEVHFRILKSGCRRQEAATGDARTPRTCARLLHDRGLAGPVPHHARTRMPRDALRRGLRHRRVASGLYRHRAQAPARHSAHAESNGAHGRWPRRLPRPQVQRFPRPSNSMDWATAAADFVLVMEAQRGVGGERYD